MYCIQEQPSGCCYVVHFISVLCLFDVVTAFGCLAMYLRNTAFHLLQGFHIMIAFGLFGFSFDHTKRGIWQCICFLIVDIITNTAALVFVTILFNVNHEKWPQDEEVQAIFLITRYSFFYLIYGPLVYLLYRVLMRVKKENEAKQELSVFDSEAMGKVKVELRSNRNSLY